MSNMEQRLGPGMLYEGPSLEPGIVRTYPDGVMWLIKPDGTRCVIPCAGGGGGGAPVDAEYVVLALNATLTAERVLTPGDALALTDGGAGGNVTLDVLVDGTTIQINGLNQLETVSSAPSGPAGGVLDGTYPNPGLNASVAGDGLSELLNVLNVNVGDGLAITADVIDVQVDGISIGFNGGNQLEVIGGALTNAVIKNPNSSTRNTIIPTGDFINLPVQAGVGQTADLQQWQSSAAASLLAIQVDGDMAWAANEFVLGRTSAAMLTLTDATLSIVNGGTNKVSTLTITGAPTGGTFTISAQGWTTTPLNFNATAADVQTALRALGNIYPMGVLTAGGPLPGTPITITFQRQFGASQQNFSFTTTDSFTGGAAPASTIVQTTTPVPTLPTTNTSFINQHGYYMPVGAAIKCGNVAGTSWIPVLYRESNNFVVLRSGDGQNMIVGDSGGTVGIGRGMTQPSLSSGIIGALVIKNEIPTTGQTLVRIIGGAGQGATPLTEYATNAGVLLHSVSSAGVLLWGTTGDVNLYRGGADLLKTDDDFAFGANMTAASAGFFDGAEIATPATPAANHGRLYFRDSGGGVTQLIALWPSGNTTVVAEDF